jgi:Domain of unknown function (DUF4129)
VDWLERAARFAWHQLLRLLRWLAGLFPATGGPSVEGGGRSFLPIVLVAVGLILATLALLAMVSFRRGAPAVSRTGPRERPAADEDPLSRTAGGWEDRARELAAQGRAREAIRAWYHAVLMRCVAQGLLHHRRGRTNWEYAHALSPTLPWRGTFEDLTSRFDVEWYGRSESTGEALADFASGAREILGALGRPA